MTFAAYFVSELSAFSEESAAGVIADADAAWADRKEAATVESPSPNQRSPVHVVDVSGMMRGPRSARWDYVGWTTYQGLAQELAAADADPVVRAVVLRVNSPGGMLAGIDEAVMAVAGMKKPVYAHVERLCASAAYWIASQASEIVAAPWANIGSIGVGAVLASPQIPGIFNGWQDAVITSSGAPNKRPDPHTVGGKAAIQASIDRAEARFFAAIAKGRGVNAAEIPNTYGGGDAFHAAEALRMGMIDKISPSGEYLAEIAKKHGGGGRAAMRAAFGVV